MERLHLYYSSGGEDADSHVLVLTDADFKRLRELQASAMQVFDVSTCSFVGWSTVIGWTILVEADLARADDDLYQQLIGSGTDKVTIDKSHPAHAAIQDACAHTDGWKVTVYRHLRDSVSIEWRVKHTTIEHYVRVVLEG